MIKAYFENIKSIIIKELNNSNVKIRIALAYFVDNDIFEILCIQAERGKSIELVLSDDDRNFNESSFDFDRFISAGGKCYLQNSNFKDQINHKFAIIDDDILITGSYNWTNKAQKNRENIVIITVKDIINEFITEFEFLKKISSDKSNFFKTYKSVSSLAENLEKINLFPTTYPNLDNIIKGFNLSELSIVAARRSMGASSLMLNFILNIVNNQNIPITLFSLEISERELKQRIRNIGIAKYFSDKKNEADFEVKVQEWYESLPIYIYNSPTLTIENIKNKIKQMIETQGTKLFFIDKLDYLKISNKGFPENKFQLELNNELIVKELRILARTFNISIILLCQLSRAVDVRGGSKKPYLTDISGNIDNYADKILFIYRPEKYNITEDENGDSTKNVAEIIVALNKQGIIGDLKLHFDCSTQTFSELPQSNYSQQTFSELPQSNYSHHTPTFILSSRMNDDDIPF